MRAIGNGRLENTGNDIGCVRPECTAGVRTKRPCTICLAAQDLPGFQTGLSWGNAAAQDLPQAHLHAASSRCAAEMVRRRFCNVWIDQTADGGLTDAFKPCNAATHHQQDSLCVAARHNAGEILIHPNKPRE